MVTIAPSFFALASHLKEELLLWVAEPSPFVKREMEQQGWRFEDSSLFRDRKNRHDISCLVVFNPKNECVFLADPAIQHLFKPKKGGWDEYQNARRQVLNKKFPKLVR